MHTAEERGGKEKLKVVEEGVGGGEADFAVVAVRVVVERGDAVRIAVALGVGVTDMELEEVAVSVVDEVGVALSEAVELGEVEAAESIVVAVREQVSARMRRLLWSPMYRVPAVSTVTPKGLLKREAFP